MGATGSFLDDLLSWFQRRHFTISSSSSNNTTQINNNNNDIITVDEQHHHHHSTPALTLTLTQKQQPPHQQFIVQELDHSSLDLIKVPNLLINSMEKKVPFFFSFFPLFFLIFAFIKRTFSHFLNKKTDHKFSLTSLIDRLT